MARKGGRALAREKKHIHIIENSTKLQEGVK